MFDIAFSELVVVSIVALLVIGPERLPETVRTIMLWLGRIRQTFTNIKTELEQEIGADEIRRQLHNETVLKEIKETKQTISDGLKGIDETVDEFKQGVADIKHSSDKTDTDKNNPDNQSTDQIDQKKAQ